MGRTTRFWIRSPNPCLGRVVLPIVRSWLQVDGPSMLLAWPEFLCLFWASSLADCVAAELGRMDRQLQLRQLGGTIRLGIAKKHGSCRSPHRTPCNFEAPTALASSGTHRTPCNFEALFQLVVVLVRPGELIQWSTKHLNDIGARQGKAEERPITTGTDFDSRIVVPAA